MSVDTVWAAATALQTLMSTDLNALTNSSYKTSTETAGQQTSGVYDNTIGDERGNLTLGVKYQSSTPADGLYVATLWFLPLSDGTNAAPVDGSGQPQDLLLIGSFQSRAGSTSAFEYPQLLNVPLPYGKFKWVLQNTSGLTFAATGNTLTLQPFRQRSG